MAGKYVAWGNTWEAVNACCAAVDAGCTDVKLVTDHDHIGSCIINGLSIIDQGHFGRLGIGYLTAMFYDKLARMLGSGLRITDVNPWIAEQIYQWMLNLKGVTVYTSMPLTAVSKTGAVLNSFTAGGLVFAADQFHDGSNGGGLFVLAGGTTTIGRESAATYGESLGGFYPVESTFTPFDCYASPGVLLPGFNVYPALSPGDADAAVMAYTCRAAITANPEFRLDWPKPTNYDPLQFTYLIRAMPAGPTWQPIAPHASLFGVGDQNGDFGVPLQWTYPGANDATKATIADYIYSTQYGWYWWLANDPSVDPTVQQYMKGFGPDSRCFPASTPTPRGVPKEIYVRQDRRMTGGGYMMTQADLQTTVTKVDSLAVGYYSIDYHLAQRLAVVRNGIAGFITDGIDANPDPAVRQVLPYQQPFRMGLCNPAQVVNLTCGRCLNMSSVASGSLRIDQQSANFSSGLGMAGGMSAVSGTPLRSLVTANIQSALTSRGQIISYP